MPEIIKTKLKSNKKKRKPAVEYLLSALKSLIFTFLCYSVLTLLLFNNSSFTAFYKVILYIITGLGAFLCGLISQKHIKGRGIVNGAFAGLVYTLIMLVIFIIIMRFNISYNILYMAIIGVFGGIIGGIMGANS